MGRGRLYEWANSNNSLWQHTENEWLTKSYVTELMLSQLLNSSRILLMTFHVLGLLGIHYCVKHRHIRAQHNTVSDTITNYDDNMVGWDLRSWFRCLSVGWVVTWIYYGKLAEVIGVSLTTSNVQAWHHFRIKSNLEVLQVPNVNSTMQCICNTGSQS